MHDCTKILCVFGKYLEIVYICTNLFDAMTTTRITVPPFIAEYMNGKYGTFDKTSPLRLPDSTDLYHMLFDLLEKRPDGVPADRGNLELILPERSVGKRPETYNYLGVRSQKFLSRRMEVMMWADAHDFIDEMKHQHGVDYKDSVIMFRSRYHIESISEDAFIKNYYRWRGKMRKKQKKRDYLRK